MVLSPTSRCHLSAVRCIGSRPKITSRCLNDRNENKRTIRVRTLLTDTSVCILDHIFLCSSMDGDQRSGFKLSKTEMTELTLMNLLKLVCLRTHETHHHESSCNFSIRYERDEGTDFHYITGRRNKEPHRCYITLKTMTDQNSNTHNFVFYSP